MSSVPTPQVPVYRITLFYGPEPVESSGKRIHCVFNVKKRSWKAGMQVVVELEDVQRARAAQTLALEDWVKATVASLPDVEREEAEGRIPDLFAQVLCAVKLDLAIEQGMTQENLTIGAERFMAELDRAIPNERRRITEYIRTELDLPNRDSDG